MRFLQTSQQTFTTNEHLGVANPNLLYILLATIIMEQKQAANYDNLLLDNLNTSYH